MFLNISTGGNELKKIVVRLCACLLIVGLVGQTFIVDPIERAKAADIPGRFLMEWRSVESAPAVR